MKLKKSFLTEICIIIIKSLKGKLNYYKSDLKQRKKAAQTNLHIN